MKVNVLGLKIDNVHMGEALDKVYSYIDSKDSHCVYTPNAEMAMVAVKDPKYMTVLNSADLIIPDGAGVVLGAKTLGTPLKEKVAGIELVLSLLSSKKNLSVFLYGGAPGIAEKAAENITKKYSSINICGSIHGYHDQSLESTHIDQINAANPDLILVGLSFPKQEQWANKNLSLIKNGTIICCGGTLNFLAGAVKRSPEIMIKLNLEWLDRLFKQPKRLGRMMRIPLFLFLCLKKRITH
ncbi:MAG: WecB/TagA/CpsF family glycosyltransferase [Clostridiales bacterium]|nr:WecB/TagA/CpsF family glycosyltransferase [Clostridiales bacterium]